MRQHLSGQFAYPCVARNHGEMAHQGHADTPALILVDDGKGHFGLPGLGDDHSGAAGDHRRSAALFYTAIKATWSTKSTSAPDLDVKRDIIQNAVDLFTEVGLGTPRVAILSAVETVTTKIPTTIDAAALCKMADRGQITGAILDGPLAFDNAVDLEAARIKGIKSEVAGRAQILVVPDLRLATCWPRI
jgi:hypothetical protein